MNIIEQIEEAKKLHLDWLRRAEKLVDNKLDETVPPLDSDSCNFGKLIHTDEFQSQLKSDFEELDTLHFLLHDNYSQIYSILVENENPNEEDLNNSKEYLEILEEVSHTLIETLDEIKGHF